MKPFCCADCGAELNPWEKVFLWDSRRGETCWICEDCFGDRRREQSNEEFAAFYRAFQADLAAYGQNHGIKAKPGQPGNFYCISCVPWLDFTAYASHVAGGGQPNLFPVITYGKAVEENAPELAPRAARCRRVRMLKKDGTEFR